MSDPARRGGLAEGLAEAGEPSEGVSAGAASDDGLADGLAVIDKPAGWTSHDVVARARRVLRTRKIGHSGTLDPDATGVLVLGVGRATRLLRYVTELNKSYEAEMVLGVETDTLDASGAVTARHDMSSVSAARVQAAARGLVGEILQVPPMVSAVKVGGRRLHELARRGIEVERAPRPVRVYRLEAREASDGENAWRLSVECSSGTYVRVLAADLGRALGGGAHLRSLRRTGIGGFVLQDAHPVEAPVLLPAAEAVRHLRGVRVAAALAADVRNGKVLSLERLGVREVGDGPWAVHDQHGALLAVYEPFRGGAKPSVVVAAADAR